MRLNADCEVRVAWGGDFFGRLLQGVRACGTGRPLHGVRACGTRLLHGRCFIALRATALCAVWVRCQAKNISEKLAKKFGVNKIIILTLLNQ